MSNETAKPGHIFVCCACGKTSTTRYGFETAGPFATTKGTASPGWDESCMLNAREFAESRIVWNESRSRVASVAGENEP